MWGEERLGLDTTLTLASSFLTFHPHLTSLPHLRLTEMTNAAFYRRWKSWTRRDSWILRFLLHFLLSYLLPGCLSLFSPSRMPLLVFFLDASPSSLLPESLSFLSSSWMHLLLVSFQDAPPSCLLPGCICFLSISRMPLILVSFLDASPFCLLPGCLSLSSSRMPLLLASFQDASPSRLLPPSVS